MCLRTRGDQCRTAGARRCQAKQGGRVISLETAHIGRVTAADSRVVGRSKAYNSASNATAVRTNVSGTSFDDSITSFVQIFSFPVRVYLVVQIFLDFGALAQVQQQWLA